MGKERGLSERLAPEDEKVFPGLIDVGYRVTSPKDTGYNCIAYAVGDLTRKWDPAELPTPGYYWPPGASRDNHPDALRSMFESLGYEVCSSGDLEIGFEKVVIYVDNHGAWSHAARQEPNGEWSSKLGDAEDVRHRTPHCFGGSIYGDVAYYLKRRVSESRNPKT
jgi:hypothetical protein